MSSSDDASNADRDVGHVLRNAGRRADPPDELTRSVRAAVEAQWREALARRSRRRRIGVSVAAGLAAVAVSIWATRPLWRTAGEKVAQVQVSVGSVQTRSGWLERWQPATAHRWVRVGESLATASDGRASLTLPDNLSVRLDRDTRLSVVDESHLSISSGAVYVDSGAGGQARELQIVTPAGAVHHVGTQYEARLIGQDVLIAVREGKVELDTSTGVTHRATAGEQMRLSSSGAVARRAISPYGASWRWASEIAPAFDIQGRSVADFLTWVGRELGRDVVYADAQTRSEASRVRLSGSIAGLSPDEALAAVLPTTPLRTEVRSGQLFVSLSPRTG